MRAVRTQNTPPEMDLRRALFRLGLRYRVHQRVAGTRPDVVFAGARVAVFVDGCFWHGCPDHYTTPKNNAAFWRNRLEQNWARDRRNDEALRAAGWTVFRFWECEVTTNATSLAKRVAHELGR